MIGKKIILYLLASFSLALNTTHAARKVIAVAEVKIAESIKESASADGSILSLKRVTEAIDGQMIDALNGTRKFEVTARSDLDSIMEDGALTGDALQVTKTDYLIIPSIDDFQDYVETATFSGIGKTVTKRKIRLGMVARIYDIQNGNKLIESANFQLDNKDVEQMIQNSSKSKSFSDELLRKIAQEMGEKVANRVVDVVYPAKIINVTGKQATINRGDGTGIEKNQLWDIYALGTEMIDPDTGESLGSSEIKVGTVKINQVNPKFSSGMIIEDFGVVNGSVVRPSAK